MGWCWLVLVGLGVLLAVAWDGLVQRVVGCAGGEVGSAVRAVAMAGSVGVVGLV